MGVHRSLGVHISFVRSTTMDTWKPNQLKLMELGGNRKLREFFRRHNIPENMPIPQKYNTRAADWYRKFLRSLLDGTQAPPPLPAGTGHLPMEMASHVGVPLMISQPVPASSGSQQASNKLFDASYHSGGSLGSYHNDGYHFDSYRSDSYHSDAYHSGSRSDNLYPTNTVEAASSQRRTDIYNGDNENLSCTRDGDALGGDVGYDLTARVSGGLWSTFGTAKELAGRAKTFAANKVTQAQNEGWLDAAIDTAKLGVGAAVETTHWAAQKGLENGKRYIDDAGGGGVSMESSINWLNAQLGGSAQGDGAAAGLQRLSTGKMQGFGSDSFFSQSEGPAPLAVRSAASYHLDDGDLWPVSKVGTNSIPGHQATVDVAPVQQRVTRSVWDDEDWGDWS